MSTPRKNTAKAASVITDARRAKSLLRTGALQSAIFNSANFSSIATDAKGVIQIFNVGAERMLGYTAAEVMNSVKDDGIGISREGLEQLFRPFSQIDSGLARKFEGTGLGLAMVKLLAELHGGAVAVESAVGEGSLFTIWLPLRSPGGSALPRPRRRPPHSSRHRRSLASRRSRISDAFRS
jgi:signal transduction histidine kinase